MLTCVTFKYAGPRNYQPEHVNALQRMLAEHLTLPHKLICITDDPKGVRCETIPAPAKPQVKGVPKGRYDNYTKLWIFGHSAEIAKRVLVLDLDILIRANIDSLITDDPFRILRGRAAPYNSSMMLMDGGYRKDVWDTFDPDCAEEIIKRNRWIGTDQGWISHMIQGAPTWDRSDGIVHMRRAGDGARIVNFSGHTKPWDAACRIRHSWLWSEYQRYYSDSTQIPVALDGPGLARDLREQRRRRLRERHA